MAIRYFKTMNTGSISDGSSSEQSWAPDTDVHIKYLFISERSGVTLDSTKIWISVGGNVRTLDFAPAIVFGHSLPFAIPLDWDVAKGTNITVRVTNNEGAAINVDLCFAVEG
jgi:hypothetical protein